MRQIVTHSGGRLSWVAVTLAVIVVSVARVSAHDFWIQPSSFTPAVDSLVRLHLRVGDDFPGEPVVRDAPKIETFTMVGPDGKRPVVGQNGSDPAGVVRVTSPGTYLIGYRSKPSSVNLDAAAFEQYLKEEGLERIIELRAASGKSKEPGREHFSRSVKSILHVGASPPEGHEAVLGLTLELVPETHPSALPPSGQLGFTLLYEGRPLEAALVVAIPQFGDRPNTAARRQARTSTDGRVMLPLGPGAWTIKAVHMVAAPAGSGADWQSIWTSLTLKAGASSTSAAR